MSDVTEEAAGGLPGNEERITGEEITLPRLGWAAMKLDEVRSCLENDGWPTDVLSDATMRTRFRCGDRIFPVFVHLEEAYATFAVIPFARLPTDERGGLLAERLLVLNREMNLAKFSLDEDGDVILSVEYPLADLDPSEVRDAIDVLSFYAGKYNAEVQAARAPEPSFPDLVSSDPPRPPKPPAGG